jgi:hypothetical protein
MSLRHLPDLTACEKAVGEPAAKWAGRCVEIASKIVGIVKGGVVVHGDWIGAIHPKSYFANRSSVGFVQHGWVYIEDHDVIVDPTRWAFEDRKPYLFVDYIPDGTIAKCRHCEMLRCEHDFLGMNAECDNYEAEIWPYDEGGNLRRAAMMRFKPPPLEANGDALPLKLTAKTAKFVNALLKIKSAKTVKATREQIFWLANLPYQVLAGSDNGVKAVGEIYTAICKAGKAVGERYLIEFIPIDNRAKAAREAGFKER